MRRMFAGSLVLFSVFVATPLTSLAATANESANNAVLFANQGGSLIDQQLRSWTIVGGVVKKNGTSAGYSANVIELAYVNHVVWQENASHLWWSWSGTTWNGGWGIATSPLVESANNTTLSAGQTATIVDQQRNAWTITSGLIYKNGSLAGYSANVTQLAYVNHVVWQENASHLWWSWSGTSWSGGNGISTGPLPASPSSSAPTSSPSTSTTNPFAGQVLYTNNWSNPLNQANIWRTSRSTDALKMDYLAAQPTAVWFGDWNSDVQGDVSSYVGRAEVLHQLPVLVAYNIPNRDCGPGYSSGGASSSTSYHDWIVKFANGIGSRQAIVILEPDAVALDCFDNTRGAMLNDAVNVLEAKAGVSVYIDAGHPNWTSAATMATRLTTSGIAHAQGFALNVANFYSTQSNIDFGNDLSSRVGGKHYLIDTSRNFHGWTGTWCNPQDAGIGVHPTVNTGVALYDAGVWVKTPGSSDGNCNGGPDAGSWWADYGLKLYNQGTH